MRPPLPPTDALSTWPEIYSYWWRRLEPDLFGYLFERLWRYRILTHNRTVTWRVHNLATVAVQAVAQQAICVRSHTRYFPPGSDGERAFRRWAIVIGWREALRLLPEQNLVRDWLNDPSLSEDNRRLLLWAYFDQLTSEDFAQMFATPPAMVRNEVLTAYRAFCEILRVNNQGAEGDDYTFPRPPVLVGWPDPNEKG